MTSRRGLAFCALFACVAVLSGCGRFSGSNCNKPQLYAQAESMPPLKVPAGLDAPDTRGALRIPALNEPEAPRGPDDPCLEMPPPYSTPAATAPGARPGAVTPAPAPAPPPAR